MMSPTMTLREAAEERGFNIGAALDADRLRSGPSPSYWKAARQFNAITPENAMKMGPLRPSRHTYDFSDADTIVDFGQKHDMYMRGHTLVWHNQKPEWFQEWTYTDGQLQKFLRDHVHTVAGRYHKYLDAWDVVNEAVADDGTMRDTVWYDAMGEEYLDLAFKWANEVAPETDLYYNDYGADEVNGKSDAIYDLLERLIDRGVPIDGVGLQLHALGEFPDTESIAANIERFRDLGLEVQITEMDVAFPADRRPDNALEQQAEYYRKVLEAFLENGCDTLVTWGVDDGSSWLRRWKDLPDQYTGDPLLLDDNYDPKPAYNQVVDTLSQNT